jgi:hypothetical protein
MIKILIAFWKKLFWTLENLNFELNQRAHSPKLAAGLASEPDRLAKSLTVKIPCSSLQGASICFVLRA